ncbi:hypothetical protein HMPREF2534_03099 [Bacteroides thetaiotaomicron]|nr:hypothetical protein HMPREF2534_03099 [Bacteroides thetaiotaomicron]
MTLCLSLFTNASSLSYLLPIILLLNKKVNFQQNMFNHELINRYRCLSL